MRKEHYEMKSAKGRRDRKIIRCNIDEPRLFLENIAADISRMVPLSKRHTPGGPEREASE